MLRSSGVSCFLQPTAQLSCHPASICMRAQLACFAALFLRDTSNNRILCSAVTGTKWQSCTLTRLPKTGILLVASNHNCFFWNPLQAIKQHKFVDLLHAPGTADLSAWVDFAAFKTAATESGGTVDISTLGSCVSPLVNAHI